MIRVDMPKPYDKIILWSWHKVPRILSLHPSSYGEDSRANTIFEREIRGSDLLQLKFACDHLKRLAQQHENVNLSQMIRSRKHAHSGRPQYQQLDTHMAV